MQIEDIKTMTSLGVLDSRADKLMALIVWGYVIHDPVIWKRKVAAADAANTCMIPLGETNRIVAAMTAQERVELRDRINAHNPFNSANPIRAEKP